MIYNILHSFRNENSMDKCKTLSLKANFQINDDITYSSSNYFCV